MNNNNKISQIMQVIISENEIENICLKHNYIDTGVKLTITVMFKYLFLSAILESKSFRELSLQGYKYGLPQVDYSTLSKKMKSIPFEIFIDCFYLIFEKCNRKNKRKIRSNCGRIIKAVDSTRIITKACKWNWAKYTGDNSGIKFHVAFYPASNIPSQIISTPINIGDSTVMEEFKEIDTLLLCDRGYVNIKKMSEMDNQGQEFIVRVRDDLNKLNKRAFDINPEMECEDYLCTLGKDSSIAKEYKSHQFRVVSFISNENNNIHLCTNIMDLSAKDIADAYRMRWCIETFFKELKQNFTIKKIFGKSQNSAFSQGIVAFITYMVTRCIFNDLKQENFVKYKMTFVEFLRTLKNIDSKFKRSSFCAVLQNIFL